MRKICSSSKTSCTSLFSSRALLEVGAERLLHDHARPLGQAGLAKRLDHARAAAFGGTLRW